jgi:ubiquinone/menaquinone biosynthesis C-methylase UbiE
VFRRSAPVAARVVGASRHAYGYLPASLDGFPDPDELVATFRGAGLVDVALISLATGMASIHVGTVPERAAAG